MWTLKEISTEMKLGRCKLSLTETEISIMCKRENAKIKVAWGSDNKILGLSISDIDCKRLFDLE